MADYIDREALKEAFEQIDVDVPEGWKGGRFCKGFGRKVVNEVIDSIPSFNVEPVVRCKDCEYSNKALYGWLWCTAGPCGGKAVLEDFYCKCGERRTDNAGD